MSLGDALIPISEFGISLQRFQHFLQEDSLDQESISQFDPSENKSESKIQLQLFDVSCVWDKEDASMVVKNVSMSLPKDELVIITGACRKWKILSVDGHIERVANYTGEYFPSRYSSLCFTDTLGVFRDAARKYIVWKIFQL